MSSYFILNLDTTPPTASIHAPNYTVPYEEVDITVHANENLSPNHEIYVIDANGDRFDLIFSLDGNELRGTFNFAECAIGVATIYAIIKDSVLNVSGVFSKTINILEAAELYITLYEKQQEVSIISEKICDVAIYEFVNEPSIHEKEMQVSCYEEVVEDDLDG